MTTLAELASALRELDLATPSHHDAALALVAALHARGRHEQLQALTYAFGADAALARPARLAAEAILARTPTLALATIDAAMRERWHGHRYASAWMTMKPDALDRMLAGPARTTVLALATTHPSGFVREAAVARLAALGGDGLPWLLVRTLDWVGAVRARATDAVLALLVPAQAETLRRALPLARRLRGFTRVRVGELVDRIEALLLAQPEVLARGLRAADRDERRASLALLERSGHLRVQHVALALDDADLAMRVAAARMLVALPLADTVALRATLVDHVSATIRAIGLEAAADTLPTCEARTLLVGALDDVARSVRALARHRLAVIDASFDVRAHYREAIVRETVSLGAIRGLGDVGTKDDWERLVPVLDRGAALAREALGAIAHLDRRASRELRLMMVDDARPSVSHEATASFHEPLWETEEPIVVGYLSSPHVHVRRNAVRLVRKLPGWRPALLLTDVTDPMSKGLAESHLGSWLRWAWTYATPPSPEDAARLRRAIASGQLGERNATALGKLLDFIAK